MNRFQLDLQRVFSVVGLALAVMGVAQLAPLLVALVLPERRLVAFPLLVGALVSLVPGVLIVRITRRDYLRPPTRREALAGVALAWLAAVASAATPYLAVLDVSVVDALVESASGLTTVGATILPDVDAIPPELHLWRGLTHWLGGAGIVLVVLIVVPWLAPDVTTTQRTEASFLTERYRGSTRATVQGLLVVYLGATGLNTFLLVVLGLSPWEALLHAFATISTGGFSTRTASMGAWGPGVQLVTVVFMLIGALSFATLGRAVEDLRRRSEAAREGAGRAGVAAALISEAPGAFWRSVRSSPEVRGYLLMIALVSLGIAIALAGGGAANYAGVRGFFRALVDSLFTVSSISTTTGFCTADYTTWPVATQIVLLGLMVVGGCSGSTAGGLKFRRLQILLKLVWREARRVASPHAVIPLRVGGRPVSDEQVHEATRYLAVYVLIVFAVATVVGLSGSDLVSSLAASVSSMGSIGPGFGDCSPTGSFAPYAKVAKLALILAMILGRLEIWSLLSVFLPSFWLRRTRAPGGKS